jgi:hypothetical protein
LSSQTVRALLLQVLWAEIGTKRPNLVLGGAGPLCPDTSDVNFLGDLERVVDLYTEVANSAFDLGMAEQKLHRTQVPSATVDQRRFGLAHRMRGEFAWIEANAGNPPRYQPGILARRQGPARISEPWKQVFGGLALGTAKVVVESLPRGLSQLKVNWPTSLPLPNIGSVDGVAIRCHIINP